MLDKGMFMLDSDCTDRELLVNELVDELKNGQCESYLFKGKDGTGKKYVLSKLKNALKNNIRVFEVIEDALFENKKRLEDYTISPEISFNFNVFFAMSLSVSKDEKTKINYAISKLKSLFNKKNILIFVTDFQDLSSDCRSFIYLLLKYKSLIELKIKAKISIIITANHDCIKGNYNLKKIEFVDYNLKDIKYYLINTFSYKNEDITMKYLQQIQAICGTNYNLINLYHKYIFSDGFEACYSIDKLIEKKIYCYKKLSQQFDVSDEDLLSILLTSSLTIGSFSQRMISAIVQMENNEKILRCLSCAESEYFIRKINSESQQLSKKYEFLSEDVKKILFKLAVIEYKETILSSYSYVSEFEEDNYLKRFQYLYQYYNTINDAIFSLVVLSISKAFIINDPYSVDLIWTKIVNMNGADKYTEYLEIIIDAYRLHYKNQYSESNDKLNNLNLLVFPQIVGIEIKRLRFRNGQLGECLERDEMKMLAEQLLFHVESNLCIDIHPFSKKEEKIFALSILYDIAPYVIDTLNNKDLFENIFDKSLVITKQLKGSTFAEYVINVFNRKAFLFRKPTLALLYYEEAERFFMENHIIDQYVMTLSSKSGILISLKKYSDAVLSCEKALKKIKDSDISIHGIEKIYNNLFIAQFLEYEQTHSFAECVLYAKNISKSLTKILPSKKGGAKHVILTNLASLALYCKNIELYLQYKYKIEESLKCKNVADITDNNINDFYRYHFAWFDFYYFMQQSKWQNCNDILKKLEGFCPAIFENIKIAEVRIKAAKELVDMELCPESRDFCINFIKSTSMDEVSIYSRGLLMSDLQFTSWN